MEQTTAPQEAAKATKKAEKISVKMDDGRTVEFGQKQKLVKTPTRNEDGSLTVRLDFSNGETRLFKLRDDMLGQFALHGASQKLGDEISNVEKIEDCVEAIDQLMQRLDAGNWDKEREGGSMAGVSVLVKALVRFYAGSDTPVTVEQVRAYLGTLDAKTKTALRASPEIQPHVKAIEAEQEAARAARGAGKASVDVASVLAGLKAGPATSVFTQAGTAAESVGDAPV